MASFRTDDNRHHKDLNHDVHHYASELNGPDTTIQLRLLIGTDNVSNQESRLISSSKLSTSRLRKKSLYSAE